MPTYVTIFLVAVLAIGAALFLGAERLVAQRFGKLILLVGIVLLPIAVSLTGLVSGMNQSSQTEFCMSCHEMTDYGKSLLVDSEVSLPAVHYQHRLIDRDTICYSCHTDYAMFGNAKAKLNGLKHVWVHYFKELPKKISLYQPYPNSNCLHCHADARNFLAVASHQEKMKDLHSGAQSCLKCHNVAHDMESVKAESFWLAGD